MKLCHLQGNGSGDHHVVSCCVVCYTFTDNVQEFGIRFSGDFVPERLKNSVVKVVVPLGDELIYFVL